MKAKRGDILNKLPEYFADNFYLRNIIAMLIYISPILLMDIAAYNKQQHAYLFTDTAGNIAQFLFFIFHSRILYERLLLKKKYFLYTVYFIITLVLGREAVSYVVVTIAFPEEEYYIYELRHYNVAYLIFIYWKLVIQTYTALGIYLMYKYAMDRARLLQAESVQKDLELKQLNNQLKPHFLFNSLNNIYSHLLRETGNGKNLIQKLSELMGYVLNSSKKSSVQLQDEITFIEHYIAFEKERLGNRCIIDYRYDKQYKTFDIVPLIMFNFIENAFKHGTATIAQSKVTIHIIASDDFLILRTANKIFENPGYVTQTGLHNAQRRLQLLYPKDHAINIDKENNMYNVSLKINNMYETARYNS